MNKGFSFVSLIRLIFCLMLVTGFIQITKIFVLDRNQIRVRGILLPNGGRLAVATFPECKMVDDLWTDKGSPRIQFVLEGEKSPYSDFFYTPVVVWGTVRTERIIKKPPEIVCIKAPCIVDVTTKYLNVQKIQIDQTPLLKCQKDYIKHYKH